MLRNGLAVTTFAAFEDFMRLRLREVASWLTSQNIPFSGYPTGLQNAPVVRAPHVLASMMKRDASDPAVPIAFQELGAAWTSMNGGGAWLLPHVALLWEGSNLGAGTALEIVQLFGVVGAWADITGVAKGAGFSVLPTSNLFGEIADRRHSAAHDASFDADILLLRATPGNLTSFAFAVDTLISSAARMISHGVPLVSGRAALSLTTIEEVVGTPDLWSETSGLLDGSPPPSTLRTGDEATVTMSIRTGLVAATDVLQVRKWNGSSFATTDWFTMGV
jgi:hypothetical protein